MTLLAVVLFLFLLSSFSEADNKTLVRSFSYYEKLITKINKQQKLWKASIKFLKKRPELLRLRSGDNIEEDSAAVRYLPLAPPTKIVENIPESFDARTRWPQCESIGQLEDQGVCGGCWAIAAASTMTDRLCIATNGSVKFNISAEDILTCCKHCIRENGCESGNSVKAWYYWIIRGVVSGNQGCKPFTQWTREGNPPTCSNVCINKTYPVLYEQDKKFGDSANVIRSKNIEEIQSEIMQNGPVHAYLKVYEDLTFLEGDGNLILGIYFHSEDALDMDFNHAVRIIGWGVKYNVPYWLIANSWGTSFGENGFFKILRGRDECQIESRIIAGKPKLNLISKAGFDSKILKLTKQTQIVTQKTVLNVTTRIRSRNVSSVYRSLHNLILFTSLSSLICTYVFTKNIEIERYLF